MHLFVEWEHVATWSNCENLLPVQWGESMDVEDWFFKMVREQKGPHLGYPHAMVPLEPTECRCFQQQIKHCGIGACSDQR
jgi:hypothetical protein